MFRGGKDGEIRLIGKETDGVAQVEEGIQGEGDVEEELELSQVLDDSPYMNRAQETEEGKEAVADCANLADHSFPHHHRDCTARELCGCSVDTIGDVLGFGTAYLCTQSKANLLSIACVRRSCKQVIFDNTRNEFIIDKDSNRCVFEEKQSIYRCNIRSKLAFTLAKKEEPLPHNTTARKRILRRCLLFLLLRVVSLAPLPWD
jgi:hypothetical protein